MAERPILAGVVGWPIDHSLSPLIHAVWAHRAGIDGYYIPLSVEPDYESFVRAMDSARINGFAGVNVTLPHKENALRYADRASNMASHIGAANMLSFNEDNSYADNSDVTGFTAAVRQKFDAGSTIKTARILGAGGSARAIAAALKSLGALSISIANRTRKRAEELAERFDLEVMDWERRAVGLGDIDILVNTTNLGMTGAPPLEMDVTALPNSALVADIVYAPLQTPLLAAGRARGCKTLSGLSMLMHQAAPGFRAWFGGECKVDAGLEKALVLELKRKVGP